MRLIIPLLVATSLLAITPAAHGDHNSCEDDGLRLNLADSAYVVYEAGTYLDEVWIYLESNGVEDLQRGGEFIVLGGHADKCPYDPNGDTVVF